jgi:hypothetical protein
MKKRKRRSHVNAKEFERLVAPTSAMRALDEGSKRLFGDTQATTLSLETRELMRGSALSVMALFVKDQFGEGGTTITLDGGERQPLTADEIQAVANGVLARAFFDIGSQLASSTSVLDKPLVTFKKGDGEVRKKRLAKKKGAPKRKR